MTWYPKQMKGIALKKSGHWRSHSLTGIKQKSWDHPPWEADTLDLMKLTVECPFCMCTDCQASQRTSQSPPEK